jgi:hypothetical protein
VQFHVPAFRYRRLRLLVDLARDISGQKRSYALHQGKPPSLHGCYYDQEDAAHLAEITYPGLTPFAEETIEQLSADPLSLSGASLAWFPFHSHAQSLREPFTGRAISEQLLFWGCQQESKNTPTHPFWQPDARPLVVKLDAGVAQLARAYACQA